jgi:predicted Zn-dependent protease with MMP-like domain
LAVEFRATMSLVFFDRDAMPTVFAHAMRDVAVRTVNIREDSVVETARLVAAEDLDVLVYLAVPTNKLAFLLAHAR